MPPSPPPEEVTQLLKQSATPGMLMGTVTYMSPERTRGLAVDRRTDTWSHPWRGQWVDGYVARAENISPGVLSYRGTRTRSRRRRRMPT